MAFDIIGYRNKYKDYYGDESLEGVARDIWDLDYRDKHPDFDKWKSAAGIESALFEDNLRRSADKAAPKLEEKQSGGIIKSFLQGGAEGLTTEIPSMIGGALEFTGSHLPFDTIKNAGKSLKDWAEEKRQEIYGPEIERTGLDRIVYEGTKMLAPSIIPGGIATTAARGFKGVNALMKAGKVAEATEAAKSAVNIGGAAAAGLFGLSQAQQTKDTAEERGVDPGLAPYATGTIEALGEFLGTKYLSKLFRLDEAEVVKRGAKQLITDLIKTIGVEVSTEMGQQSGEAAVEKYSGIRPEANPIREAIDVIGPTTFMTILTGGLAGAANKLRSHNPEEKKVAEDVDKLKAGAMASMTIHEGLKNGEVDGKPFTPDHAVQLIKTMQEEGVYNDEDINRLKQQYPSLSYGINSIIADNTIKQVDESVRNALANDKGQRLLPAGQGFEFKDVDYGVPVGKPYGDVLRPVRPAKPEEAIDADFTTVMSLPAVNKEENKQLPYQGFELSVESPDAEISMLQERIKKVGDFLDRKSEYKGNKNYNKLSSLLENDKKRLEELTKGGEVNGTLQTETTVEPKGAETAPTWFRGVDQINKGTGDHFYSADESIAGDFGKVTKLSENEMPKNPLVIGSKEELVDKIGYKYDPMAEPKDIPKGERFDILAKKYAQEQGHDGIIYNNGTMEAPELHVFGKETPTKEKAPETPVKETWQQTREEFIKQNKGSFVREKGRKVIAGVQIGNSLYQLPEGSQKNGKFLRPANDILGDIHKRIVKESVEQRIRDERDISGSNPYIPPGLVQMAKKRLERPSVSDEVLKDYPDLQKRETNEKEIFIRAAEKRDLSRVKKTLKDLPDKFGYEKVYKRDGKQGRGFYYVKANVTIIKEDKPAPNPSDAQNLVTYLQRAGKVRLGEEFSDKTGDAWSRAHGFRYKDRSRELGDIAITTSKNGKMAMDEAAGYLNAEGFKDKNGEPFTDRTLYETLASGEARNILHPDHQERIIEGKIDKEVNANAEREEAEYYDRINEAFPEEIDTGRTEVSHSEIVADLEEKADDEGYSPEESYDEINSFFDDMVKARDLEQERRINYPHRKKVSEMTPEERATALLTDHLTGLKNKRAYDENNRLDYQCSIDVDGLKYVNDTFGHDAGNELLKKVGDALNRASKGEAVYHFHGDEFAIESNAPDKIVSIITNAKEMLKNEPLNFDGNKYNADFSQGIAKTMAEADKEMLADKTARKVERGKAPEIKTENTEAGKQVTIPGASETETFSLTAKEPETPVVKGNHLAPKNLQPKEKSVDMFAEGTETNQQSKVKPEPEGKAEPVNTEDVGESKISPDQISLTEYDKFFSSLRDGQSSLQDLKNVFTAVNNSKDSIIKELSAMTKDALLKRMGGMRQYRYKNDKKSVIIDAAYNDMISDFALGNGVSYQPFKEKYEDVIGRMVDKYTEEDIADFAKRVEDARAEHKQRMEGTVKAINNPETLEDFQTFLRVKGKDKMTPEQARKYDDLVANNIKSQNAKEQERKATVRAAGQKVNAEITETKHTKTGEPLFVVRLDERVEREVYNDMNRAAKKMGGWYSSYKVGGAVPGFQFKTKETAEAFKKYVSEGDTQTATDIAIDRRETKKDERKANAITRLRGMAEKLSAKSNEELTRDRQTNTARRARMASGAEDNARAQLRIAETMKNIADAIEAGEANHLSGLRTKAQIEMLNGMITIAQYDERSKKYESYLEQEKHKGEPATIETVDFIRSVVHPRIHKETLLRLAEKGIETDGIKRIAQRWVKMLGGVKGDYAVIRQESDLEEVKKLNDTLGGNYSSLTGTIEESRRMRDMGIETPEMERAALREFIQYRAGLKEADKVKLLERSLIGKNVGFDFFPTPKATAEEMVDKADIQEGMDVLEPSAGNGNIAEAIKDVGVNPDVAERSSSLREVLEAKGFNLVAQDFLDMKDKLYDRIIMNPPFSNSQDIDHVRHAYGLLKPDGRIVAIMGEGAFFRNDKKATEFREWLDSIGGTSEKLEEGTFTDKSLIATTGVNARMVVIDKGVEMYSIGQKGAYQLPTISDVQDVFKGQEVIQTDKGFIVNLPNGKGVLIEAVNHIEPNRAVLNIGYSKGQLSENEVIAGKYDNGNIELTKGAADKWTLSHESVHFMEDFGIIAPMEAVTLRRHIENLVRDGKYQTANKEDIGGPEDRANFIADALSKPPRGLLGRIINKVQDFIDKLVNLVTRTPRGIIRDIESGDIFHEKRPVLQNSFREIYDEPGAETGLYNTTQMAEPFYSQLLNTVTTKIKEMPGKINSIIPWLNKNQVKPAEMKWMGVEQWLKDNAKDGAIDKQKFADFLKGNQIEIKEVTKRNVEMTQEEGDRYYELRDELNEQLEKEDRLGFDSLNEARQAIREYPDFANRWEMSSETEKLANEFRTLSEKINEEKTKFHQYTLPGGENYRELLLTLPEVKVKKSYEQWLKENFTGKDSEHARELYKIQQEPDKNYQSGHWDEPNVLAHVRMNDRVDADGKKVLFIEEVQSDWHQEGKKKGYSSELDTSKWTVSEPFELFGPEGRTVYDSNNQIIGSYHSNNEKEAIERAKKDYKANHPNWKGVPSAPFAENWHELVMKRMLRHAAENGYDKIAWTTGEQQAERYDLSKQLSEVSVIKNEDADDYLIEAWDKDGMHIDLGNQADNIPENKLEDYIGKDLAKKVIEKQPRRGHALNFEGLDLKVGGEGMKSFYDNLIPGFMNKYVKQWGAKVGETNLKVGKGILPDGVNIQTRDGESIADAENRIQGEYAVPTKVPSVDITPEMKHDVLFKGQTYYSIRKQADPPVSGNNNWIIPEQSKLNNLIYKVVDKQIDLRDVVKAIEEFSNVKQDTSIKETLYSSRLSERIKDFSKEELQPIYKKLASQNIELEDFEDYLWNRHAKEANEYIRTLPNGLEDGGSGILDSAADDYMNALAPEQKGRLEDLARMVDDMSRKTCELLVNYGLESQETIDTWFTKYEHYVPLFREDVEGRMGVGQGYTVSGSATRGRKGSERKVVDILANLAMQRERALTRGEKNIVSTALVSLAKSNPNTKFWNVINMPRVNTPIWVLPPGQEPMVPGGIQAQGVISRIKDNVVVARIPDKKTGEIKHVGVEFNESNERALRMAEAMKNLDMDTNGAILGAMGKVTRWIASVNTQYNPVFGVTNFFRDTGTAAFNLSTTPIAGKQKDVVVGAVKSLKQIFSELRSGNASPEYDDFRRHGGTTGYRDLFTTAEDRTEQIKKDIKAIKGGTPLKAARWVFDLLSDYNTTMENAIRFSSYKVGIANGMSKEGAAYMAKNLTVNFNRKGQIAGQASALYAFFNASVQGSARMYETIKGPAGRKIIIGGILFGAAQAMMLAAAGFDDDEPPDFVREKNIIIPIGGKRYISIPMPLGFNVLPNIGRVGAELTLSGGKDAGKKISSLFSVIGDSFNPMGSSGMSLQTISPTPLDPLVALAENKDWTGKPIYKEDFSSLDPTPGFSRARSTATLFGKGLSWTLNLLSGGTQYKPGLFSPTPDQIDYLAGQATGGIGREIAKVSQVIQSISTGEELPTYKIPLAGRFYGKAEGGGYESGKYYDNITKLNMHENEIKGLQGEGKSVSKYLQDNPEARYYKQAGKIESDIKKLKEKRKKLESRSASREYIDSVNKQIQARMKQLNDAMARY